MARKRSSANLKSYRQRVKTAPSPAAKRRSDALLILVSLAVLAFVASFALKFSLGEASPPPAPPTYLRIQVLNGCGVGGAATQMAEYIKRKSTPEFVLDVYDVSNHKSFKHSESQLLVREATAAEVTAVAELLGFPESRVIQKKLDDNFLDINFTVLVGEDFATFLEARSQP
ncbi:MAG: LytR C-terminal domain-containing protein [bacterium]